MAPFGLRRERTMPVFRSYAALYALLSLLSFISTAVALKPFGPECY